MCQVSMVSQNRSYTESSDEKLNTAASIFVLRNGTGCSV